MGIYELVKHRDCWERKSVENKDKDHDLQCNTGQNSLEKSSDLYGNWKWTVKSVIDFNYTVQRVPDVFSKQSKVLLVSPLNSDTGYRYAMDTKNSTPLRRIVFVDKNVHDLYHEKIEDYFKAQNVCVTIISFETSEETKNMANLMFVLEEIEKFGPDRRNEPIIAIGGGVCLDIVGLAATLYRRRTPYIRVPTTLLALVDASVGAKTGINYLNGKNKLGAYVPPYAVFLDSSFLKTLPKRQLSNGMGEIMKMALVKSKQLFDLLEKSGEAFINSKFQTDDSDIVIQIAIETMLEELVPNLWEDDLDRLVDFGHVISPVLEMDALPALLHGEAVNIDMAFMCVLSSVMGYLTQEELHKIINCMKSLHLPVHHSQCTSAVIEKSLQARLKHGNGKLRLPMPCSIGKAKIVHILRDEDVKTAFHQWQSLCMSTNVTKTESSLLNYGY